MFGIGVNVASVICGGLLGALIGKNMSHSFAEAINQILGLCAIGMGINSIILLQRMPAVILAVVLGSAVGLLCQLGAHIRRCSDLLSRHFSHIETASSQQERLAMLETAIVLFCFSATGIYGCLDAGMTGSCTILLSKSILDLFTAMVFACSIGIITVAIAVPQAIIFVTLFWLAKALVPLMSQEMLLDFKSCGGFLLVATGCRIAKLRDFPVADMLPAMILIFPLSALWGCLPF